MLEKDDMPRIRFTIDESKIYVLHWEPTEKTEIRDGILHRLWRSNLDTEEWRKHEEGK